MADISEVLNTLSEFIGNILYPDGTNSDCIVSGADVMIYPGWPVPDQLDKDMELGNMVHISVFPRPGEDRNTTRQLGRPEIEISVGADSGEVVREVGRQEQVIQLTIWSPTPELRDNVAKSIIPVLKDTVRLEMVDELWAMMSFKRDTLDDKIQKFKIYRRDIIMIIEYATTITASAYTIKDSYVNSVSQTTSLQ